MPQGERVDLATAGALPGRYYIEELTTSRGSLWRPIESYADIAAEEAAQRFRHLPPCAYPRRLVHVVAIEERGHVTA